MSILTENRSLALQAYKAFESIPKGEKEAKHYLNTVQQAMLKLETQGLRRCILYITSQMGKKAQNVNGQEDGSNFSVKDAYSLLYDHLADVAQKQRDTFQYEVLRTMPQSEIVLHVGRISFFLLCMKRLVSSTRTTN
jgi:hypothetical protein